MATTEEIQKILQLRISERVKQGWSVQTVFGATAVLSKTTKMSFWKHFLLAVFTGGLGLIYTIYRALNRKREGLTIQVLEDGKLVEF